MISLLISDMYFPVSLLMCFWGFLFGFTKSVGSLEFAEEAGVVLREET